MTDRIAVVVVAFGGAELITTVLSPLRDIGARLIVVDNHRSDADSEAVLDAARSLGAQVLPRPNLGFGAGCEAGIVEAARAGAEIVVLVNPDLRLSADTLLALVREVNHRPDALVAPVILRNDRTVWSAGGTLDENTGSTRTLRTRETAPDWLSGACLAFRLDAWHAVGGFDPDYFMYWEDIDLSVRWRTSGRPLAVIPETAIHDVGATQTGEGKSSLYVYYNCRNRLLFARNLTAVQRVRWSRDSGEYARRVLLRGGRRALLGRLIPLTLAAVRGTADGRRALRHAEGSPLRSSSTPPYTR